MEVWILFFPFATQIFHCPCNFFALVLPVSYIVLLPSIYLSHLVSPFYIFFFTQVYCTPVQNSLCSDVLTKVYFTDHKLEFCAPRVNREMTLGGYLQRITTFHTMDGSRPPFPVLVFVATPQSRHWLGPAPLQSIAKQVTTLPLCCMSEIPYLPYTVLFGS
jgi:hypothetical protein